MMSITKGFQPGGLLGVLFIIAHLLEFARPTPNPIPAGKAWRKNEVAKAAGPPYNDLRSPSTGVER
jgi:hypothetical protein